MPAHARKLTTIALTCVMAVLLCLAETASAVATRSLEKTASGNFFAAPAECTGEIAPESQLPQWEIVLTATPTASGRQVWLSADPIGEDGGVNLYEYVESDPVNFTDELGLEVRCYASPGFGMKAIGHLFFFSDQPGVGGAGRSLFSGGTPGLGYPEEFTSDNKPGYPSSHVTLSNGMTDQEFIDRVREDPKLNVGVYTPYLNDCHNAVLNTAENAGATFARPAPRVYFPKHPKKKFSNFSNR